MAHQFSLFGFQKPISKVPISAERIREVKELIEKKKDGKNAAIKLREIREGLENYLNRIK